MRDRFVARTADREARLAASTGVIVSVPPWIGSPATSGEAAVMLWVVPSAGMVIWIGFVADTGCCRPANRFVVNPVRFATWMVAAAARAATSVTVFPIV